MTLPKKIPMQIITDSWNPSMSWCDEKVEAWKMIIGVEG